MSAKRRADTIAAFCVPVQDVPLTVDEPVGTSSRLRPVTQSQSQLIEIDDDGDSVSDFAPDDESDHSATEFESDEEPRIKRRGKGKGKAKAKYSARSSLLEGQRELDRENPRVMLISLKGVHLTDDDWYTHNGRVAGALGLNLTVANNVFL